MTIADSVEFIVAPVWRQQPQETPLPQSAESCLAISSSWAEHNTLLASQLLRRSLQHACLAFHPAQLLLGGVDFGETADGSSFDSSLLRPRYQWTDASSSRAACKPSPSLSSRVCNALRSGAGMQVRSLQRPPVSLRHASFGADRSQTSAPLPSACRRRAEHAVRA